MPLDILSEEILDVPFYGRRTYKYAKCDCGADITLDDFSNWCDNEDCENVYDISGHRLSNPRFWGEETGEHWADVANVSWYNDTP